MVIVDVRPDSERAGGGIPTDAYVAVEEIKDVRATSIPDWSSRLLRRSCEADDDGFTLSCI